MLRKTVVDRQFPLATRNQKHGSPGRSASVAPEDHDNPASAWTDASWDEIVAWVHAWCSRLLGDNRNVELDADDACEDVLVKVLRLDFGKRLNRDKGNFWTFLYGLILHECWKRMRAHYRSRGRFRPLDARIGSKGVPVLTSVELAEFARALSEASRDLTATELIALPRVLERAEGSRRKAVETSSTAYVQEHRCRQHLAMLLRRFRPER
jgi:DNA-directed RNA polymerase specialized sigma24 family protein